MAKNVLRRPLLRKVVRGYDPEQVDLFVRRAMDRVATLDRENDALRRRLDAALSEIEELKAQKIGAGVSPEDGAAARDALTEAAEKLLGLAARFEVREEEPEDLPEEIEAEDIAVEEIAEPEEEIPEVAAEPEEAVEDVPEEAVEEIFYEEPAGEAPEEEVIPESEEEVAEVFYEEEAVEEETPDEAETEPEEEEEVFEFVEDLTKDLPEEIENEIEEAEETVEEAVEEIEETIPEEIVEEAVPIEEAEEIKEEVAEEDDDLLAKLKESLTLDGPDFPDDPLANLKDRDGEPQPSGYEDYSFTELLRGVLGEKPEQPEEAAGAPEEVAESPAEEAEAPAEDGEPASPDDLDFYSGEEHADGEDFDPSSLIRRNRPGRDIDKK